MRSYVLMLVSIPILWVAAVAITKLPPFLLPPPELVLKSLIDEPQLFLYHTGVTIFWALLGYLIANIIAIVVAISFVYAEWAENFATPWMVVIKNVPFVTIASILVITLGQTPLPKIIIVVLITFFPLLANILKGLRSADQVLLDRMAVLNASKWQIFWKVRWPSALPYYIAGHESAFTGSIIGAIVAEWLFAREGLGFLIVRSLSQYRADKVYAVTLIASILAVGAYISTKALEKYLFKWKESN
jgi:NitT/TauT family transport system permease protein